MVLCWVGGFGLRGVHVANPRRHLKTQARFDDGTMMIKLLPLVPWGGVQDSTTELIRLTPEVRAHVKKLTDESGAKDLRTVLLWRSRPRSSGRNAVASREVRSERGHCVSPKPKVSSAAGPPLTLPRKPTGLPCAVRQLHGAGVHTTWTKA